MASKFSVEAVFKAIDRVTAPINRMSNSVGKFTRKMGRGLRSVNRTLDRMVKSLKTGAVRAIGFTTVAVTGLTAGILGLIREASKIEDATAAFTPLLGGAKRAEELVAKLNKTAASTPFQFNNLAKAAGQLIPVMEGDIDKTVKTLRMLGDTAGGNAQKLESITRGFTKAMLKGKVDMESLNMIAEAGVPIFTELADSMGTKVNKAFFKMISAGDVATTDLTKAFEKMTSAGGVFFEGMVIASKTQSGLFSTLKDNISLTAAAIGQQLLPTSKKYTIEAIKVAGSIREWVTANKDLIGQRLAQTISFLMDNLSNFARVATGVAKIILAIVAASATFKAVMISSAIVTKGWAASMFILNGVLGTFSLVMKGVRLAMMAFNVVAALNPIGAIALAVGLLITAGVLLVKNWDKIKATIVGAIDSIKGALASVVSPFTDIFKGVEGVVGSFRNIFGGGGDAAAAEAAGGAGAQVVSPQERVAKTIEESRQTSTAELTIKDETGRGELTQKGSSPGIGINLAQSGAF